MFNPKDWYWAVGGSTTQVYSSTRNAYVSVSDTAHASWLAAGNSTTPIDSEKNIWPYVADIVPGWMFDGETFARPSASTWSKPQLKAYAALMRFNKEVGGVAISNFVYPTDRETQAKMTAAVVLSQVNPATSFQWKLANGSFVALNAADILAVAKAAGGFVQGCFIAESDVVAAIDAGSITDPTQIDAAFSGVV